MTSSYKAFAALLLLGVTVGVVFCLSIYRPYVACTGLCWDTYFVRKMKGNADGAVKVCVENQHGAAVIIEASYIDSASFVLLQKVQSCGAPVYIEKDSLGKLYAFMYKINPVNSDTVDTDSCLTYWYLAYPNSVRLRIDTSVLQAAISIVNAPNKAGNIIAAYNEDLELKRIIKLDDSVISSHSLITYSYDVSLVSFDKETGPAATEAQARNILQWVYGTDCCKSGTPDTSCIGWQSYPSGCDARAIVIIEHLTKVPFKCAMVSWVADTNCDIVYKHTKFDQRVTYGAHHVAALRYDPPKACVREDSFLVLDPLTIPFDEVATDLQDASANLSVFTITQWRKRLTHECNCTQVPGDTFVICESPDFRCFHSPTPAHVQIGLQASRSRLKMICSCGDSLPSYLY